MQGNIGFTGTLSGQIDDSGSGGTSNYNELTNKPSINSVPLVGNKTTEDLHLFSGDYDDLSDRPAVNGITLSGNKTTADLGLFSGNYNDLTNKPTLFSGDYNDLTNKPTLFSGDYNDLTNKPNLFDGDYDSLTDRPTINNVVLTGNKTTADLGLFSGNYNDLTNKPTLFDGDYDSLSSRPQINGNLLTGNKTTADLGLFSGNYNDLTNKPTLFSGNYNDLTNKPYIPDIDMTPAGAATEEVDKIELDTTVYEVKDAAARTIIGDGQLDPGFTATDLTGAANELKSNLVNTTIGKGSYSNTIYGAYGFISGGGKTIYLTVPISLAPDVTSVAFTSFKIGLRLSTSGYAGGADNTEVASLITDTWLYPKNGNMMVKIVSTTAFSADNNICCVGTANMTGTFS